MCIRDRMNWMYSQLPFYQRQGSKAYKPNLARMSDFVNYLGNPQNKIKIIHVGGTNGKGSTSHMIASVLQDANYKVGLYTSPHIKSFRERIKINGNKIGKKNIIVPKELQEKIVTISHEGHQGLVKSKMFLRSKMWFPGMDKMVEKEVKVCAPCQAAVETPCQEPMTSTELPNGPWEHIAIDFKGPLKTGEYAFVAIDEYSRYPEVEFVSNTSAKAAIPKLDKILSTFGIPLKIRSDNGSPFNSESFKEYAKYMGFEHIPITPVYPKANGLVENFMKNIVKVNRTAIVERKSLKQELYKFLRVYRATPHCSTQKTPAELMFQARTFRARRPEINTEVDDSCLLYTSDAADE